MLQQQVMRGPENSMLGHQRGPENPMLGHQRGPENPMLGHQILILRGPENPMLGHQILILESAQYSNNLQHRAPCCYSIPVLGSPLQKLQNMTIKLTMWTINSHLNFKRLKRSVKSDKF